MLAAFLFLILSAPAAAAPPASAEKNFTLDEALRLARLNDPRLLSAEQDKVIAKIRESEALYLFLPEFGVQASATKYSSQYPFSGPPELRNIHFYPGAPSIYGQQTDTLYSGRGYMNLSLFEGGRTLNTLRLASAASKQALSSLEGIKLDINYSVRELFFRLILAQERAFAADQFERACEEVVGSARLDPFERVEAEAKLAESRIRASESRHHLTLTRLSFLKGVNVELDTAFAVTGALEARAVSPDLDKLVLWAMELRPELQAETYRAQMDAISVNLAAGRRIPTVFAAGDYEATNDRFPLRRNNWDISIGVRIPFSYDYLTQIRQKRAEQRQGQIKRAELQDRVRLEVRQAYETLIYWQKEWPQREQQYRKIQTLFDAGTRAGGNPVARLRAMSGVLDLRLGYLTSVTEQIIALAKLERAVGRSLSQP